MKNKNKNGLTKDQIEAAIRRVAQTADGRILIDWLLDRCGYGNNVFNPEALQNSFNQGRQLPAIWIAEILLNEDNKSNDK